MPSMGCHYYPKLLTAVPFTPVRGPRLLVQPGPEAASVTDALIRAATAHARSEGLSSWHVLFPEESSLLPPWWPPG